mgnify:CR=1 FL=1
MDEKREIESLRELLIKFKQEGKIKVALLYGSCARGASHKKSDIDIALFISPGNKEEEMEIIDEILMSAEKDISILRLDNEDESPFVTEEALKGIHLVEPDLEILYKVSHRVLHECEEIRFRRSLSG